MVSNGEDERLFHMDTGEPATPFPMITSSKPGSHTPQSILKDILLEATEVETQVLEKVLMYVRNMGEPNSLKKWVVMSLQKDGYEASLCKTSWVSTFGPKVFHFASDYEYIDVMMGNNSTRLIVDMDFKSQFEVARPTQAYKELSNSLPSVFVGTEERLNKIISLLCSAAKQSLEENGLHIPPWRKAKYMQSKWLSKNCKKVSDMSNTELGLDKREGKGNTTCCPSIF